MAYRVVYGETIPAWEKIFARKREADAFVKKHLSFGDIIFCVEKYQPGDPPRSLMAIIEADQR